MQRLSSKRFRKALMMFVAAAAIMAPRISRAKWSPDTQTSFQQMRDYEAGIESKEDYTEERRREFGGLTVDFANNLIQDILRDLRLGHIWDASAELDTLLAVKPMLEKLGRFDEIRGDLALIKVTLKKVSKRKEVKKDFPAPRGYRNLPAGEYVFACPGFYLKLSIRRSGGSMVIDEFRRGFPLKKEQWQVASKGKPRAVVKYVEEQILKQNPRGGTSKKYIKVRRSGEETLRRW